jgi:hypothetical protein
MQRDIALDHLPMPYAVVLRLRAAGASDDVIAAGLATDPAAIPAMVELAQRKLDELVGETTSGDQGD